MNRFEAAAGGGEDAEAYMSAEAPPPPPQQQRGFPASSPAAAAAAAAAALERVAALDLPSEPLPEMETLRMFVSERLTAAVDDILGVFGEAVVRYREQIERQRRQLDSLRTERMKWEQTPPADAPQASCWIKTCPEDQILSVQLDQTAIVDAAASAARVKTEAGGEDGVRAGCPFEPAGESEAAGEGRLLVGHSETDDSEDYAREAAGLWRPEEAGGDAQTAQRSSPGGRSGAGLAPALAPALAAAPALAPAFSCRVCGESFQKRSYLMTHAAAHLRDCSVCGKHLEQPEHMKRHLRVHRETSFCCGVCGQTFTLRGNLRTHMRIHSGERPFGCTICGKSFGRRATLVRHVRSHTGEKPFACSYCGRGFIEKGNLTVHLRTHTGERPYWCSNCDRRFSQLSCYNKHPCQRRGLSSALAAPT